GRMVVRPADGPDVGALRQAQVADQRQATRLGGGLGVALLVLWSRDRQRARERAGARERLLLHLSRAARHRREDAGAARDRRDLVGLSQRQDLVENARRQLLERLEVVELLPVAARA